MSHPDGKPDCGLEAECGGSGDGHRMKPGAYERAQLLLLTGDLPVRVSLEQEWAILAWLSMALKLGYGLATSMF